MIDELAREHLNIVRVKSKRSGDQSLEKVRLLAAWRQRCAWPCAYPWTLLEVASLVALASWSCCEFGRCFGVEGPSTATLLAVP